MIISGKNSVWEALNSNKTINKVLINKSIHDEFSNKVVTKCKELKIRFDFVDKFSLEKLVSHKTH